MIDQKALNEYKEIYRKQTGKDISDEEAMEQATRLVRLVELVYKPITQEEFDMVNKRRHELNNS